MVDFSIHPHIAIINDDDQDYSSQCLKDSLCTVGCHADIINPNTLVQSNGEDSEHIDPTNQQFKAYDLIIYRYQASFSRIVHLLNQYDGPLIVYYYAEIALGNLRAYSQAAPLVRQRELDRQQFCEWVQVNAQRVSWLADSRQAADDLIAWGVINSPPHLSIVAPFVRLQPGLYAAHAKPRPNNTLSILIADHFIADSGHKKILDIISHYQAMCTTNIEVNFTGTLEIALKGYIQEIKHHAQRLGIEVYIHTSTAKSKIDNKIFLRADLMIHMADNAHFSTELVQAQAMGLPVLKVSKTEPTIEASERLAQALLDPAAREQLILQGYRSISHQHTTLVIEQQLLSTVATSLIAAGST